MPASSSPTSLFRQTSHNNQQLFSDYYLNQILPSRPEWRELIADAEAVQARLTTLFAAYQPSTNKAQTEREWVQPVLEALGHDFEVQAALKSPNENFVLIENR